MEDLSLWGLFLSAFISSTLFPGGSEVVVAYLAQQGVYSKVTLLVVATTGNTLGGMSTWLIGYLIARRFPARTLTKPQHQKARERIERWGSPALLFSWVPVVGDPLCLLAGWLRIHAFNSLVFIATGKAARYAAILFFVG